jgi:hypothetical protein
LVLVDWIVVECKKGRCNSFVVLLPGLPGERGVTTRQLNNLSQLLPDSRWDVILVAPSGETRAYSPSAHAVPNIRTQYFNLFKEAHDSADNRIKKKIVRRLGHFRTLYPREGRSKCRQYSFYLHDCAEEMGYMLSKWWEEKEGDCVGVLYDLKNNPSFRHVLRSFADARSLRAERITDVCQDPELAKELSRFGLFALVLDVLDSGTTLRQHIEDLSNLGIKLSKNVLVGINKSGHVDSACDEFRVNGFVSATREAEEEKCIQCQLGLAISDDAEDPYLKIRSYDMLSVALEHPWVSEPILEVPGHIGYGYDLIPDFTSILREHGRWLSYKIHRFLKEGNCPDDWFVVHPNEPDSSSITDSLQEWCNGALAVVRIPRPEITKTQEAGNDWDSVLSTAAEEDWVEQLNSLSDTGALIVDVFNASGSTARSLAALLRHMKIVPFGYFCLVNFAPGRDIGGVPNFALYDWYNPRKLKTKA